MYLPSDRLEIQNDKIKAIVDSIKSHIILHAPPSNLTFQLKGLNMGENNQYRRFLAEQNNNFEGEF